MSSPEEQVTLVGGPCDGEKVPVFPHQIHVPITSGRRAHHGEHVDEVAVYQVGISGSRAYFVNPYRSQA